MSGGIYGGDEVGAVVFDIGTNTTRVGYAGEDTPKGDISTTIGIISDPDETMEVEDQKPRPNQKRYHFDPQHTFPISHKEMVNPLKEGMIEDWDLIEKLLHHVYAKHICDKSDDHPVLMSEPAWNTKDRREKLTELLFEKFNIPAFYLCKSAVLSAFAHGRSTGLVLDSGAAQTSAVPVHDGYVLQKGIVRSPVASDVLIGQCENLISEWGVDAVPAYMIKSKREVPEDAEPDYTLKQLPELTDSFKGYMKKMLFQDFQKTVLQVSDSPYDKTELDVIPSVTYEFPHGHIRQVMSERFRLAEGLFDTAHIVTPGTTGVESTTLLAAPNVINTSIGMCDIDIRPGLYNSVIVVGGTTLINGFVERLNRELLQKTPNNMRLKLVSNNQASERRFSSWIGGSVLGSLGSFQQMWISKQEYQETGKGIVEKKCS